ncbi:MAG: hypothetical protein SNH99_01925 [Rikenellaceae bacterium]
MEKKVLRVDERGVYLLVYTLENEIIPAVTEIIDELKQIGVDKGFKEIVTDIFNGNYTKVKEFYNSRLEQDAARCFSKVERERIVEQFEKAITDFKDFAADTLSGLDDGRVEGVFISKTNRLDYITFSDAGELQITQENKDSITELFTTYIATEEGEEFEKIHTAYIKATTDLYDFCEKHSIRFLVPSSAFCVIGYETGVRPKFIDYDKELRDSKSRLKNYED